MMKIVLFCAGVFGKKYIKNCPADVEIVAVVDNNWESLRRGGGLHGYRVVSPSIINDLDFDYIVIAVDERNEQGCKNALEIRGQLLACGVPLEKLLMPVRPEDNEFQVKFPRREFLKNLSQVFREKNITGAVAECGVCWGDFAEHLNRMFPDRMLYLFDTFESFDSRDFAKETGDYSAAIKSRKLLATANAELVYIKCPYKEKVRIIQGYVPDTFSRIEDSTFCFVNLDMDLYNPTLASLKYFEDKIVSGGVILVHDYYLKNVDGVKQAVDEFFSEQSSSGKFLKMPIGDDCSVAIIRLAGVSD